MHGSLLIVLKGKLKNNQFLPNSISHKDLNALMSKAKRETVSIETSNNDEIIETKHFNDLIADWTKTSRKLLLMLKENDKILTKTKNPKSIMAFGAMGAHINMALQALKAAESDQ